MYSDDKARYKCAPFTIYYFPKTGFFYLLDDDMFFGGKAQVVNHSWMLLLTSNLPCYQMYVASNVGLRYILNGACLHFSPPFGISQCLMTFNEMSVNPHYGGTPTRYFGLGLVRVFFCARAPRRQQPHRAGAA